MTGDSAALAGLAEVAEILGVSKQRAHQIVTNRYSGFPDAIAHLRATPVWREADVQEFARMTRRTDLVHPE